RRLGGRRLGGRGLGGGRFGGGVGDLGRRRPLGGGAGGLGGRGLGVGTGGDLGRSLGVTGQQLALPLGQGLRGGGSRTLAGLGARPGDEALGDRVGDHTGQQADRAD